MSDRYIGNLSEIPADELDAARIPVGRRQNGEYIASFITGALLRSFTGQIPSMEYQYRADAEANWNTTPLTDGQFRFRLGADGDWSPVLPIQGASPFVTAAVMATALSLLNTVPAITGHDVGDVLTIGGSGFGWAAPVSSVGSIGNQIKVRSVNSYGELTAISAIAENVYFIKISTTFTALSGTQNAHTFNAGEIYVWDTTSASPEPNGLLGWTLLRDSDIRLTSLVLDSDGMLIAQLNTGAQLTVDLNALRVTEFVNVVLVENDNDLTISVGAGHSQSYSGRDEYEFRATVGDNAFSNTGAVQLRVRYSTGGSTTNLPYKAVLDIHGLALEAGAIHANELIAVRYDTGLDAWISNIIPEVSDTHAGLVPQSRYQQLLHSIPAFATLPNASGYDVSQLILVDGKFYRNSVTATADVFAGVIGTHRLAVEDSFYGTDSGDGTFPAMGHWTSNPNRIVSWLIVDDFNNIAFAMKQSSYRTAKTSDEADGDQLNLVVTVDGTTENWTVTIIDGAARTVTADDGTVYLTFRGTAPNANVIRSADVGDTFTLTIQRGGANFITHDADVKHWVIYPLDVERLSRNQRMTVGNALPTDAALGDLNLFMSATTGLMNLQESDGTAKADVRAFDLVRFDGTVWRYVGFIGDTDTHGLDSFDALPDAANYDNGKVIVVDGRFYKNVSSRAANTVAGITGETSEVNFGTLRGTHAGDGIGSVTGEWTSNPDRAIAYVFATTTNNFVVALRRNIFRTAKGSNEASGDQITAEVTVGNTTQTVTLTVDPNTIWTPDGLGYLVFEGTFTNSVLSTSNVGTAFTMKVKYGGNDIILHAEDLAHWVLYPTFAERVISTEVVESADVRTVRKVTQTAYDAITTKDANTLYAIVG